MKQSQQFSECSRLNQEFRKEIRRKDIEHRFAERRRQLLQQQRQELNGIGKNGQIGSAKDNSQMKSEFEQIYARYLNSNNRINGKELKQLAKYSCGIAGSSDILKCSKQFINHLVQEFIMKESYNETQQQNLALLIINNCLSITTNIYAKQPNKNNHYSSYLGFNEHSLNNQYFINAITTTEQFILRIFCIALQTKFNNIKQNAMSLIFCIVYNNEPNFVHNLVTNPKFLIISLLFNQMHTQPHKSVVGEVFRCYFLIIKKLQFASLEQFAKMRKFIIFVIKTSNSLQISMLSTLCLQALLKSLPNEKSYISKCGILSYVFERSLFHKNSKLIGHALKIATEMIQVKNQSQIKAILQFIEECFCNSSYCEHQIYCLKLLYDMLSYSVVPADVLITNYTKLFNKMIELFDQNSTAKQILLEISYTLCLLANKSKKINKSVSIKISTRLQQILQNWDLDQKSIGFLQHALQMLKSIDRSDS